MRRLMVAVVLSLLAWAVLGTVAGAIYPPEPAAPTVRAVKARVIVVRGAPARRAALAVTGTSSTVPLVAVAAGSLALGLTVVGLTGRRRDVGLSEDTSAA